MSSAEMSDALIWLVQLLTVVGCTHGAGWLAARLGPPRVVGEMAAGLLLGRLAPSFSQAVFAAEHLGALGALSQLGLLLFVFLMGLEMRPEELRQKRGPALAITLSSNAGPADRWSRRGRCAVSAERQARCAAAAWGASRRHGAQASPPSRCWPGFSPSAACCIARLARSRSLVPPPTICSRGACSPGWCCSSTPPLQPCRFG